MAQIMKQQNSKKIFRTHKRNLVIHPPGNKDAVCGVTNGLSTWSLFFYEWYSKHIFIFTNKEIWYQGVNNTRDRPAVDITEDLGNTKITPSFLLCKGREFEFGNNQRIFQ